MISSIPKELLKIETQTDIKSVGCSKSKMISNKVLSEDQVQDTRCNSEDQQPIKVIQQVRISTTSKKWFNQKIKVTFPGLISEILQILADLVIQEIN